MALSDTSAVGRRYIARRTVQIQKKRMSAQMKVYQYSGICGVHNVWIHGAIQGSFCELLAHCIAIRGRTIGVC